MKYDYLIVGSGLFGSVFAHEMKNAGKRCLVIEKRNHIGGNCHTENRDGINVHTYGPHIFHTNDNRIWEWINRVTDFHNYKHSPKVNYKGGIYSFPINLMTLHQLWGVNTPEQAKKKLDEVSVKIEKPSNLEEWILSQVGEDIYETFIKGYTKKQWNRDPKDLPASIIKRLPIRTNYDDNYFFDKYQGIPVGGYTQIFEKLLDGIEVMLETDYFSDRERFDSMAEKIVFTGKIDEFFGYCFGELEYRSLRFENERVETEDYQGCSIVNYTEYEIPHTRITEHKHFENSKSDVTWITREYPMDYNRQEVPYYPVNDEKNNSIYTRYKDLASEQKNVIFGGRLAEYKYYDMHQIIGSALSKSKREINSKRIDVVVAKYKEDVSWTGNFKKSNVIVYDKSESPGEGHISLPNVGREAHTYLHHIIENYDNLAEYTCFLQGNPFDGHKGQLDKDYEFIENYKGPGDFLPLGYQLTCNLDGSPHHLHLNVGEIIMGRYFIDIPETLTFTVGAQFMASRNAITNRKKEFYENLLSEFQREDIDNVGGGGNRMPWIMERLWGYAFNKNYRTIYDRQG